MRIIIAMMLLIALSAYAAPPVATTTLVLATPTAQITWDRSKQPQRVTVEEMLALMKAKNAAMCASATYRFYGPLNLPTETTEKSRGGSSRGKIWVNSYTRKDGTVVSGYWRRQ